MPQRSAWPAARICSRVAKMLTHYDTGFGADLLEHAGLDPAAPQHVHLLQRCRKRGYSRVLLETGSMEEMAPARSLYESVGFVRRPPYGHYTDNGINLCYELTLER